MSKNHLKELLEGSADYWALTPEIQIHWVKGTAWGLAFQIHTRGVSDVFKALRILPWVFFIVSPLTSFPIHGEGSAPSLFSAFPPPQSHVPIKGMKERPTHYMGTRDS